MLCENTAHTHGHYVQSTMSNRREGIMVESIIFTVYEIII